MRQSHFFLAWSLVLSTTILFADIARAASCCQWVQTSGTVCVTDYSGRSCTTTLYLDEVCGYCGSGTTGGGGGSSGQGSNPFDSDQDGKIDCFKDLTQSSRVTSGPLPTDKNLGGRYGGPHDGVRWRHNGIDVRALRGDPVRAAKPGTVTEILTGQQNRTVDPNSHPNGNFVRITYSDGTEGVYLHLHTIDTSLSVGSAVDVGQILGTANNTGHSFGDHLHYTNWQRPGSNNALNSETIHGSCP